MTAPPASPAAQPNYLPMVEMRGVTKRFPGVIANDRVDLDVGQGSIHALLGENGAGKSTLMHILSGLYRPDAGQIRVEGREVAFSSPLDAIQTSIGMVHQHFMLVETQTVAENVVLGDRAQGFHVSRANIRDQVLMLGAESGLELDPDAYIWQLSVGERQRVEIVKMLHRGARLLILDEPTSVLTPQESTQLFTQMRQMTDQGRTLIFISHKLEEVMALADWITVLRGGRVQAHVRPRDTDRDELVRMMVGRPVMFDMKRPEVEPGAVRLALRGVCASSEQGEDALHEISLEVRAGEILGIAGVAGNGQRELAETITGLRSATRGEIRVNDQDMTGASSRQIIDAGVAYIPQDRQHTGTAPNVSLEDNLALKTYRTARGGYFINPAHHARVAAALLDEYAVVASSSKSPARLLSGGNLQKLILARELSGQHQVLVAESPTRGLDIGAIESVHEILLGQKSQGLAILLISEDLQEILTLSDRIAVIYEGGIMGIVDREDADVNGIGLMMAGARPAPESA